MYQDECVSMCVHIGHSPANLPALAHKDNCLLEWTVRVCACMHMYLYVAQLFGHWEQLEFSMERGMLACSSRPAAKL